METALTCLRPEETSRKAWLHYEASLKKNCVFGVSVGQYCGQSGGHFFFFVVVDIFLFLVRIFFFLNVFFAKIKKKVPSRRYFTHPGATPETEFFFSLA